MLFHKRISFKWRLFTNDVYTEPSNNWKSQSPLCKPAKDHWITSDYLWREDKFTYTTVHGQFSELLTINIQSTHENSFAKPVLTFPTNWFQKLNILCIRRLTGYASTKQDSSLNRKYQDWKLLIMTSYKYFKKRKISKQILNYIYTYFIYTITVTFTINFHHGQV